MPVFVVGLGSQIDQPYLEELAAAARTPLMLAPSPEDLHALYSRIGQSLRYQYVVTVNASTAPPGEALLRLSVTYDGSVVVAERPFTVPAPPEPPAPLETPPPSTPPPPPVEALPEPTPATRDRGSSTGGPFIGGGAVGRAARGAAGALTLRLRRRGRRRRQAEAGLEQRVQSLAPPDTPPVPAPATEESVAADVVAELLVVNEAAGAGRYQLTGAPATIGFTPDCTIVLGHDDHLTGEERVRIWRREGKFMLHRLSRRGRVAVGGRPVAWAVLEDGDEIEVGPWRLRFSLRPEAAPPVPRHHARG
jgi:predicted component of type VI protein secretion system